MNWRSVLLLLALVLMTASSCTGVNNERVTSLQAELDSVETQIASAEKENDKYTGGLVKALINSQIETLKQTRAMLQQRRDSWLYGVNLSFTVEGKQFVMPAEAKALLPNIEHEIAENKEKIKEQELVVSQYSGGLVHALSVSTLETMRQTQAMLEQRRLAIKYELPQYLAFQTKPDTR